MSDPASTSRVPPRAAILAVPIATGMLVVGSGLAWLIAIQFTDGEARGGRVHTTVTAPCDAMPALTARLDDFGLAPAIVSGGLEFSLPGLRDDLNQMPVALTRPGVLTVDGLAMVPNHAGVQISLQGGAVTLLTLDKAVSTNPKVELDGESLEVVESNGGELQLAAWAENSSDALRLATDRAVAMRHPLPCAVSLSPLTAVGSP